MKIRKERLEGHFTPIVYRLKIESLEELRSLYYRLRLGSEGVKKGFSATIEEKPLDELQDFYDTVKLDYNQGKEDA